MYNLINQTQITYFINITRIEFQRLDRLNYYVMNINFVYNILLVYYTWRLLSRVINN